MTEPLSKKILNEREFGTHLFHVGELREWLKSKRLHLRTEPAISDSGFVQVEMLLCRIENAATKLTFEEARAEVAKDPRLSSDPAAEIAPAWLIATEAPLKWRKKFVEAVRAGELQLLDCDSTLPIASAVPPEQTDSQAAPDDAGLATEAVVSVSGVVTHSTRPKRRNILDPVIEIAQSRCSDPVDTMEVFAQLEALAQVEHSPLLASTPDGLKYNHCGKDAYLTKDALDKRLHPEKRERRR